MRRAWSDLSGRGKALRVVHGLIAAIGLGNLSYVWFCALSRRRDSVVRASVTWLVLQGAAAALGRGNCPLGPLQARWGDPTPCFELVLPPRAAKAVFPTLLPITMAGLGLLAVRRPERPVPRSDTVRRRAFGAATAADIVGLLAVADRVGRRLGATRDEVRAALPGDDLVPGALWTATRGVTIRASAEAIWPWLVQMGYHRAGWYTFALIDNQGQPHPDRVVPELQRLAVGDVVPDAAGNYAYWIVAIVHPPRALVYTTVRHLLTQRSFGPGDPPPQAHYRASWAFVLQEHSPGRTRLMLRWRMRFAPRSLVLLGPGDALMQLKMLRTIKRLVERSGLPQLERGPGDSRPPA